jgi:hypothetical protein
VSRLRRILRFGSLAERTFNWVVQADRLRVFPGTPEDDGRLEQAFEAGLGFAAPTSDLPRVKQALLAQQTLASAGDFAAGIGVRRQPWAASKSPIICYGKSASLLAHCRHALDQRGFVLDYGAAAAMRKMRGCSC